LVAVLIGARERYRLVRDALYLLRPAWDKPNSPKHLARLWIQLANYYHPNITDSERCASFGWQLRQHDPNFRVIDATLITVELEMLEIRLEEVWPYVDLFLIVEANVTFTGLSKPLIFAENRHRFEWAESKIVYRQLTVDHELLADESQDARYGWVNVEKTRDAVTWHLRNVVHAADKTLY